MTGDMTDAGESLARCCEEEYGRYFRAPESPAPCCYDLARAALQARNGHAMTRFYGIFEPLCRGWAATFPGFAHTGEPEPDVFVNTAFTRLYLRINKDTFERFPSLAAILAYLKRCVITAILQHLRRPAPEALEEDTPVAFSSDVEREQIWQRVSALLAAPDDRRLIDLRFRQDIKPAEIAALHPETWPTARHVTVALQRVLYALRKDAELRARFGLSNLSGEGS